MTTLAETEALPIKGKVIEKRKVVFDSTEKIHEVTVVEIVTQRELNLTRNAAPNNSLQRSANPEAFIRETCV